MSEYIKPADPTDAAGLRANAAAYDERREASFQRSDTDGFLSQWADGISASEARIAADIAEAGGYGDFPALFKDGALVPARVIETRWGPKWAIFASAEDANAYDGKVQKWVGTGRKVGKAGFTYGLVKRLAKATIQGRGRGLSGTAWAAMVTNDGLRFNPAAEVIETDTYGPGGSRSGPEWDWARDE